VYACANTICDAYEREMGKADVRQQADAADSDGRPEEAAPQPRTLRSKVDVDARALSVLRTACGTNVRPAPPAGTAPTTAPKRDLPVEPSTEAGPDAQRARHDAPRSAGLEAAPASTPAVSSAAPPGALSKGEPVGFRQ